MFGYMEDHSEIDCILSTSAAEILDDKPYDLMTGQKLKLREDVQLGFFLEGKLLSCLFLWAIFISIFCLSGQTIQYATTPKECLDFLKKALQERTSASTKTNAQSSRSHLLLKVIVTSSFPSGGGRTGTLLLADLAGSEKQVKSGADGILLKVTIFVINWCFSKNNILLQQASHINSSLSALSEVISSLVRGSSHIPFRNTALTKLLRNSLSGNSKTIIMGCLSPSKEGEQEAISTIHFLTRSMSIKTMPTPNLVRATRPPDDDRVENLMSQVDALETEKQELKSQNDQMRQEIKALQTKTKQQTPIVTMRQYA
jgi:Kinesin motor domain